MMSPALKSKNPSPPPEQKEAYTAYANLPNGAVMLGQYATKKEARKELDYLVDSILKGERRFSFCAQRMQNWRGL